MLANQKRLREEDYEAETMIVRESTLLQKQFDQASPNWVELTLQMSVIEDLVDMV